MEKKTLSRRVAAVLLIMAALVPVTMRAFTFEVGGIYYDVTGREATVTYKTSGGNSYSGDVVIPETVNYSGAVYQVTAIGNGAFTKSSGMTSVTIPNSIVSIGDHAFVACTGLREVFIPNSVKTMGRCVFHSCSNLNKAVIGNSVKLIDEYAFQYCNNLTDLVIGTSVDSLAIKAFFDCHKLVNVTCLAVEPPAMYAYYCFDNYGNATLSVNKASIDAYRADPNWKRFRAITSIQSMAQQLRLDRSMITLHGGESQQLSASVQPEDASPAVVWSTSNAEVATVNASGVVTAVGAGLATITATTADGSNLTATCGVRVLSNGVQDNNVLTLPQGMAVEKGKPCLMPVAMINKNAITAVQCDLTLPEGIVLDADGDQLLIDLVDERASASHGLYSRMIAPNVVRIVISSPQSEALMGNDGDLMLLHLNVSDEMEDGDYHVMLSNVILADASAITYYAPDVDALVTVQSYAKGDANGDGSINVGDYVTVANYILNMNPDPFIYSAADVDENSTIDVGDLVGVANIVLGDFTMPENAPRVNNSDVMLTGESTSDGAHRVVVTLNLNNDVDLTAWQMDLALPEGMSLAQASLSSRATGHSLAVNEQQDGKLRLLGSSMINDVVTGHEGALLTLVLEGNASGNDALQVSDVLLAEADMTTHAVNPFSVGLGNSAVKEVNSDTRIYVKGSDIIVETPIDTTVELIAPNGMSRMLQARAGINTYRAERGLCIVRAGGRVAKLNVQ